MFEAMLVQTSARTAKPWTVVVSFAVQLAAVGAAVLIPLVVTDSLPQVALQWTRIFAPTAPPGPPPAPKLAPVKRPKVFPSQFSPAGLLAPRSMPKLAAQIVDTESPPENVGAGAAFGIPGGTGLPGALNPVIGGFGGAYRPPEPAAPPEEKKVAAPAGPDRIVVGGLVRPPVSLFAPQPVYPRVAVQARIFGVVRLEAVIGTDGLVRHLRLVQGHPMLTSAAIEAVRQWRYTPTLLNGDPVELIMQVDVHFTLRQ